MGHPGRKHRARDTDAHKRSEMGGTGSVRRAARQIPGVSHSQPARDRIRAPHGESCGCPFRCARRTTPTPFTARRRLNRALRGAREWAPWASLRCTPASPSPPGSPWCRWNPGFFQDSAPRSNVWRDRDDAAIASGMIALTGIVFSLAFVMVQFSATAYSPRLVLRIARDRVTSHAMECSPPPFFYAITAIAGVDRSGSGRVLFLSLWIVVILLVASVGMFIGLIQRIGVLQVSRVRSHRRRGSVGDCGHVSSIGPRGARDWINFAR